MAISPAWLIHVPGIATLHFVSLAMTRVGGARHCEEHSDVAISPAEWKRMNRNPSDKQSYVYIMTNKANHVLYTGVTSDLLRRVWQHKEGTGGAFTKRYNVNKLVYHETFSDIRDAIAREKQIKNGPRKRKIALIESTNPEWRDIYHDLI